MPSLDADVVIVGAGVAGLRCAQKLVHEHGIKNVLVVDALDRIGGRILQDTEYIPGMTIEVGAELVHGANTSLTRMAEEQKWNLREIFTWAQGDGGPTEAAPDGGIGYYYLGDQGRMLAYDDEDKDFCKFNESVFDISKITDVESIPEGLSMLDYFKSKNLSESMMKLADAGYANTAGARLDEISFRITCKYERQWIDLEDEGDYRMVPSFGRLVDHLSEGIQCRLSWPVQSINYTQEDKIVLTSKHNTEDIITCRRVVVTVPTSVFQDIEYLPALPQSKVDAVNSFGMHRAAKIHLHMTERFWPENTHGVVCSDCFIPEFWINGTQSVGHLIDNGDEKYPADKEQAQKQLMEPQYLITGFASSECANKLSKLPEKKILETFVSQLDMIYGTKDNPTPASSSFVKGRWFDWGDVPYIMGGYSFPKLGQTDDASKQLADSIDARIFFAGEATAYEQPGMSVHSAIDTGTRGALEVAQSL